MELTPDTIELVHPPTGLHACSLLLTVKPRPHNFVCGSAGQCDTVLHTYTVPSHRHHQPHQQRIPGRYRGADGTASGCHRPPLPQRHRETVGDTETRRETGGNTDTHERVRSPPQPQHTTTPTARHARGPNADSASTQIMPNSTTRKQLKNLIQVSQLSQLCSPL